MTRWRVLTVCTTLAFLAVWFGPTLWAVSKPRSDASLPVAEASNGQSTFSYPALGISAPVTINQQTNPTVTSDWSKFRDALTKGVSLSFDSATFETAPLAFVVGHSSDSYPHPYSNIFAPLNKGKVGDLVNLNLGGKNYQFKIVDKTIIGPTDVSKFMSYGSTDPKIQRLEIVTCWPIFTSAKRLTLIAERLI